MKGRRDNVKGDLKQIDEYSKFRNWRRMVDHRAERRRIVRKVESHKVLLLRVEVYLGIRDFCGVCSCV